MLIQCQSCNTKYRLNLESIPKRKSFVKCKRCGTPIFIDPGQEAAPGAGSAPEPAPGGISGTILGAIPGAATNAAGMAARPVEDPALVICENCGARYRVPLETLRRDRIRLKCSQCNHVFEPRPAQVGATPVLAAAAAATRVPPVEPPAAPVAPEPVPPPPPPPERAVPPAAASVPPADFYPPPAVEEPGAGAPAPAPTIQSGAAAPERAAPPAPLREREMPLPDEARLESLFDDLKSEPVEPKPGAEERAAPAESAERAYLDATSLSDDEPFRPPERGTIPAEQRSRYFLDPQSFRKPGTEPDLPALPDLAGLADLAEGEQAEEERGAEELRVEAGSAAAVAALDERLPAVLEPGPAETEAELPMPLPMPKDDAGTRERKVVEGQDATGRRERRVFWSLLAAGVLTLVLALLWGIWVSQLPRHDQTYTVEQGQPHQLALPAKLEGHYVHNVAAGQRLFVVTGDLTNLFGSGDSIGWVRLRGQAWGSPAEAQPLTTTSFIGNVLDDQQLGTWELGAIRAYYGFNNGRNDANYDIPSGKRVPFQLAFFAAEKDIVRTEAAVISYILGGKPVYVQLSP
ncbi:MAG: zinc-ribbon domain-containing protein [Candidatus Lambdaproteobacteria bacterium]|nr:zinc-ribbon domain-containing protein [Candidatus Lambdaproteobacteria bacterium]